jgi:hypothetical protein
MNLNVHARAERELPAGQPPAHIQWMSPGRQTIQPMGMDAPFEMEVTSALAAKADAQLQQLRRKAAAGLDVEPYLDANHKDEARMAKAKRFWWGGDDLKTGGIRLDVEWTGAGIEAVRSGALPCVSASWMLNKFTKEFIGISPNVGGLVPRSAFTGIQVFAKASDSADADPFYARVQQVMDEEGIDQDRAWRIVLEKEPELWIRHMYRVLGFTPEQARRLGIEIPFEITAKFVKPSTYDSTMNVLRGLAQQYGLGDVDQHPFCVQARLLAEAEALDEVEAARRVAAKSPSLYQSYRDSLGRSTPAVAKQQPVKAQGVDLNSHAFCVAARTLAASEGIDFVEASRRVAAKQPQLFSQYREAMARS